MSTIQKSISTKATASEMKLYINSNLLSRKELTALFDSAVWIGDTLNVKSKIGSGTVALYDNRVEISIDLTFFGRMAAKQIDAGLDAGFKQLTGH